MLSKPEAGRIHQNMLAFLEKGPWVFAGVELCPENEEAAASFGGTCQICSQGIKNLVYFTHSQTKERVTVGLDCAATLEANRAEIQAGISNAKREQAATRETLVRRRTALEMSDGKRNALVHLDRLVTHHPTAYGRSFGESVGRELREGYRATLTGPQRTTLGKLFLECHTDEQLAEAQAREAEGAKEAEKAHQAHLARYADVLTDLQAILERPSKELFRPVSPWDVEFAKDLIQKIRNGDDPTTNQAKKIRLLRKEIVGYQPVRRKCKNCGRFFFPIEEDLPADTKVCGREWSVGCALPEVSAE